VVSGIEEIYRKRKSIEENHSKEECLAKKLNAILRIARPLAARIMGRIYEVESEDEEL
jgi:hypothetical protein